MTRADTEGGFTLLEVVCVVAIIATIIMVLLPIMPRGTSRPRLEAYAIEIASLLKADRTAAIRRRSSVATEVNPHGRIVRSGATGRIVRIPEDVTYRATLPQRCNQRPVTSRIDFFASGMSCGGAVMLTRYGVGYEVRVNWLMGGVEVAAYRTL